MAKVCNDHAGINMIEGQTRDIAQNYKIDGSTPEAFRRRRGKKGTPPCVELG